VKNVTIHDVAKLAEVSTGTVSAVLNQKETVNKGTQHRVQKAISQLNYRPSAAARRRLQPSSEKTLGLVIKEVHNPYFADVITGAQEAAGAHGYHLLVTSSERKYGLEQELVELLIAKDVDGLIINPLLDEDADLSHLYELKRRNIPLVLLESVLGLRASMLDVDNVSASRDAVEYLIESGHEHIVHFAGPRYSMHSDERIKGVRSAFSGRQVVFDDNDIVHAGARLKDGYRTGLEFFGQLKEPPTAVTCYNDLVAIGLIRALLELGFQVPGDVSVVGYDDIDMACFSRVPLTTVRVPKYELGRQATEFLIQQIEAHDAGTIEKVMLETELIIRESTRILNI
jgi:DNA-binding LacI/PurR family transcriptional regulator